MIEEEIWKDIDGYPGYEVSNMGRVKSLVKAYRREDKILSGTPNTTGYVLVQLYPEPCKRKSLLVHRLVMITFQPNPMMDELHVNHKDLNTSNNKMSNLEWVTEEENSKHYWRTADISERLPTPSGEDHHLAVLTDKEVLEIRTLYSEGNYISKRSLARHYGVSEGTLRQILKGDTWKHLLPTV